MARGVPPLLLLFALCTGIAIVISGNRPGLEQGLAQNVAAERGR